MTVSSQSLPVSKILATIPIHVSPFSYVTLGASANRPNVALPTRILSVFDISIVSDSNKSLDLNGLSWSCSVQFDIVDKAAVLAPHSLQEKLGALGLRHAPRVLPSRYRTTLEQMSKGNNNLESNLDEVQTRARARKRPTPARSADKGDTSQLKRKSPDT